MPTKLTCLKVQKTWFFSLFLRFYPGKLRVIILKSLFIDFTVKNTPRKVYLMESIIAYRTEMPVRANSTNTYYKPNF